MKCATIYHGEAAALNLLVPEHLSSKYCDRGMTSKLITYPHLYTLCPF